MLMIRCLHPRAAAPAAAAELLALPFDARKRSRLRLRLADGRELGWALTPGTVLHPGDRLEADDGSLFEVRASAEPVLRVSAGTPLALTRAAYHLGNRHIAVEVGVDYLALEPDPVLHAMLLQLGVQVAAIQAPFQPETGAYGGGHKHGHDATFGEDYALAQALFRRREPGAAPAFPAPPHAHPHVR